MLHNAFLTLLDSFTMLLCACVLGPNMWIVKTGRTGRAGGPGCTRTLLVGVQSNADAVMLVD